MDVVLERQTVLARIFTASIWRDVFLNQDGLQVRLNV